MIQPPKNITNEILFILVSVTLLHIPFLSQAYHVDDWIYLRAAQKFLAEGYTSFHGFSEQMGISIPNFYLPHPLLWPWIVSVFLEIIGTLNESLMHLLILPFSMLAALSAYSIAKKFSDDSIIITIFLVVTPAFMLMSHVVMTDIPTLAFFLMSVGFFLYGIENESTSRLILSGFSATMAWAISYQALFLLMLYPAYLIIHKYRITLKSLIPVFIPLFFFILWCIQTALSFGTPHPFVAILWGGTSEVYHLDNFLSRFVANINAIGSVTIFSLVLLFIYGTQKFYRQLNSVSFIIIFTITIIFMEGYYLSHKILFSVFLTTGIMILVRTVLWFIQSIKEKNNGNTFLSFWALSFFAAIALIMPLGIARYLLPGFLPLIIMIVADIRLFFPLTFKKLAVAGILLTLLIGSLLSIADYQYANVYKRFADDIKNKFPDKTIWFSGESGFRLYMQNKGFKYLLINDERPRPGDILVVPTEIWPVKLAVIKDRSELVERLPYSSDFPFRILNQEARAGFYMHVGALLPYSISRSRFEEFSIYLVNK